MLAVSSAEEPAIFTMWEIASDVVIGSVDSREGRGAGAAGTPCQLNTTATHVLRLARTLASNHLPQPVAVVHTQAGTIPPSSGRSLTSQPPLPRSFHLPCTEAKLARAQTSLLVTFPLSTSLDYPIWRPSAVVSRASTTSRGLHPPPLHRGRASLSLDGLADHLPFLSHLRLPWPPLRATAHTLH